MDEKKYVVRINIVSRDYESNDGRVPPVYMTVTPGYQFKNGDGVVIAYAIYEPESVDDAYRALDMAFDTYSAAYRSGEQLKQRILQDEECSPFGLGVYDDVDYFIGAFRKAGFDVTLETMTARQYHVAAIAHYIAVEQKCYREDKNN